jgi:sugar O-acyltransferase (sialic acid O-acetyltransferase NeuD family)
MDVEEFTTIRHPLQAPSAGERIVIVGTGETAAVAFEYFCHDTRHEVVAFSAEAPFMETDSYRGLPVVPFEQLADIYSAADTLIFVAVALVQLNRVRRRLYHAVKAAGFDCISYVSSHAVVMPGVRIGENSFVQEHAALQYGACVGDNVFLGSGTCLGYQSVVEDDCYAGPHVTVGEFCRVGSASFLGANSCITDGRSVAEDCIIGAGAVVLKDTAARQVYLGNPARPVGQDSFETFGVIGG